MPYAGKSGWNIPVRTAISFVTPTKKSERHVIRCSRKVEWSYRNPMELLKPYLQKKQKNISSPCHLRGENMYESIPEEQSV